MTNFADASRASGARGSAKYIARFASADDSRFGCAA